MTIHFIPAFHPSGRRMNAPLRVLIGCETSGVMRRAFAARGHDVWSCDLLPADDGSNRHIVCDVRDILGDGWDMLAVMHPPCTRLCNSGVRWLSVPPPGRTRAEMWAELDEGAALFSACWNAPIERVAVENPVMHKHARERLPVDLPKSISIWHRLSLQNPKPALKCLPCRITPQSNAGECPGVVCRNQVITLPILPP